MDNNRFKKNTKWFLLAFAILSVFVIIILINSIVDEENIAIRLTDDSLNHGPIEFKGEIYFPSSIDFPESRNTEVLAKIIPKDNSIIIELINQDVLVGDRQDANYTHLKTKGGDDATKFTKASFLEDSDYVTSVFENHSKFVLCNDDQFYETRIPLDEDIILKLENTFVNIKYEIEDFSRYDKLYYIFVDSPTDYIKSLDGKETLAVIDDPIIYIGCIFSVDSELYYGNLNNHITGELAEMLTNIINNNKK